MKLGNTNDPLQKRYLYPSREPNHFWNRCQKENITDLRDRNKLKQMTPNKIQREMLCWYTINESSKRGGWKAGVIKQLIVGKDGRVTGASVRMTILVERKLQYSHRAVQELYHLEIIGDRENRKETDNFVKEVRERGGKESGKRGQPNRAAAQDAQWKTKLMLDSWHESRRGNIMELLGVMQHKSY